MLERSDPNAPAPLATPPAPAWPDPAEARLLDVGRALRDYCAEQLRLIAVGLGRRTHHHRGVHEARKGIRRLRSTLALGAPRFGARATRVDKSLQRLGRTLSTLRDAHVAVELARTRAKHAAQPDARAVWKHAAAMLQHTRAAVLHRELRRDAGFGYRLETLARCGQAVLLLPWELLDAATVTAQLARSRRRADRAAQRCAHKPKLTRQHKLRKRLRRHRMQVGTLTTLLETAAATAAQAPPGFRASVAAYASTLDEVAGQVDAIGAHLDATLLRHALQRLPRGAERKAALRLLRSTARAQSGGSSP